MEQSPSGLDDARIVALESSTPGTPFTLKAAFRNLTFRFRTSRRKQLGPPPKEEERQADMNEIFVQPTLDVVLTVHNTNTSVEVPVTLDTPALPSSPSASAVYSSPRIDRMMQTRSTFSTELEFEIESSKVHWSEVAPLSDDSELVPQDPQAFIEQGFLAGENISPDKIDLREICDVSLDSRSRDQILMCMLYLRWPFRFQYDFETDKYQWKLGRKIAEGAQAEIYEALPGPASRHTFYCKHKYVYKVFREGFHARDLQRLWPKQLATGYSTLYTCPIRHGILFENGRFAFLMPRYWGDLRKFLDQRMQQRCCYIGPPCSDWEATRSMLYIAKGMRDLHISNIVHRDLKASNVLVEMIERSDFEKKELRNKEVDTFYCRVADFESSKGVLGTGFWRAPEILVAAKNRTSHTSDLFTKASDVYSYAMTCYEIWTGCIPFENIKYNDYDIVIGGGRPILPRHMKYWVREMLERCWHADPCKRPTFQDICDTIADYMPDQHSIASIAEEEKQAN